MNLFESEQPSGWQLICGTALTAPDNRCKNPICSRSCNTSRDGFCAGCSRNRTSTLKDCGFQAIKLTAAAMVPPVVSTVASQ